MVPNPKKTMINPDQDVLEIIREIVKLSGGCPARMYGLQPKKGSPRWFFMRNGYLLEGSTQREILDKFYVVTFMYGWR